MRNGKQGGRAEIVVLKVEKELLSWLSESGAVGGEWTKVGERTIDDTLVSEPLHSFDSSLPEFLPSSTIIPTAIERPAIVELSQTPGNLVWAIGDPYTRFLIHCIARYYSLVSFSKLSLATPSTPSRRLTHILRPIVVRPDNLSGMRGLDTPPTTDLSASEISELESAGYLGSELDSETGAEEEETPSEAEWEDLVVAEERNARETLTRSTSGGVISISGTSSEDGRETRESTTDEDDFSEDGEFERDDGVESVTSSIASLPPLTPRTPSAIVSSAQDGTTTPTPRGPISASSRPSRLSNALFLSSPTPGSNGEDGTTTPRGKSSRTRVSRSSNSSPSRSPSRGPRPSRLSGGVAGGNGLGISRSEGLGKKKGWELPVQSFAAFVFE